MFTWCLAGFFFFLTLKSFLTEMSPLLNRLGLGSTRNELQKVNDLLREMEDTLLAGMVPDSDVWQRIRMLPEPWGSLASDSLAELRRSGGALIPTLQRLRSLAVSQLEAFLDARAKSSQASSQALACSSLVPALGFAFYLLLPSVRDHLNSWFLACTLALGIAGLGALWLFQLAEVARWGGLKAEKRDWILSAQCAGERFLALLRTGTPADQSWGRAMELLRAEAPELALAWGFSIWEGTQKSKTAISGAEGAILATGSGIKKSIQVSIMEGRPCVERVETLLKALNQEMNTWVDRELGLLTTRALKPLFICVAPALLGLLFFGLWLASEDLLSGALNEL